MTNDFTVEKAKAFQLSYKKSVASTAHALSV